MQCIVGKRFMFEASHVLPKHPGKCSRLHGHSWSLEVKVVGIVDGTTGFVTDYYNLAECVNENIVRQLDHTHLGRGYVNGLTHGLKQNDQCYFGPDFYPSSENLVCAIARMLEPLVQELPNNPRLYEVTIGETCTSTATWRRDASGI